MVEDIGLNLFIFVPDLVSQEEIYFYRQAELGRFSLGYDQIEILSHNRVGCSPSGVV